MDGRYTWTIKEIIADPRYRQFAKDATEHGKTVLPEAYPWNCMGMTDEKFLAAEIRYESGALMADWIKREQLGVVRAQEELVVTWWHWWPGWEEIDRRQTEAASPEPGTREAAVAERNPCRPGAQGTLF